MVTELAAAVDETLPDWIAAHVDFATSMVDRITPATTDEDRRLVATTQGYDDAAPVPTEPYAEWVVAGRFPAGRPRWEDAGAKVVDDVGPYEQRKLWLLNGSHSLLAYAGSIRGHSTIDEAIGDPQCRELGRRLLGRGRPAPAPRGRRGGRVPRGAAGPLRQPAGSGTSWPRSRRTGRSSCRSGSSRRSGPNAPRAGCRSAAPPCWRPGSCTCSGQGAPVKDPGADAARAAAAATDPVAAVSGVLDTLADGLSADRELVDVVVRQLAAISRPCALSLGFDRLRLAAQPAFAGAEELIGQGRRLGLAEPAVGDGDRRSDGTAHRPAAAPPAGPRPGPSRSPGSRGPGRTRARRPRRPRRR